MNQDLFSGLSNFIKNTEFIESHNLSIRDLEESFQFSLRAREILAIRNFINKINLFYEAK